MTAGGAYPGESPGARGFTLVELMVALLIFGLLSAAGVYLLAGSVGAQGAIQTRLGTLAEVQRVGALMTADLAQAVPRVTRTESGTLAPAFFAGGGTQADPAVQFVRTGRDNPDDLPRSAVQKLEYGIVGDTLVRRGYPQADGAAPGPSAVLLDRVTGAAFRFRGPDGGWREDWRPTEPTAMPRAVELTVARSGDAPVRLMFLVGLDPAPRPRPTPGASPSPTPTPTPRG